ncbi:hypothetical protein F5B19DRAFT_235425 [Rostrohypoxylon terebratum]|nr:hypothetical protein F5B19DRAFT_235425 [Rostrohypoxylon terebratum]
MGGVMYHNNIPTAAAEAMALDHTAMRNGALQKLTHTVDNLPPNESVTDVKHVDKGASKTKHHARTPEPTVFIAPTPIERRQINTSMLDDISDNAVSFATGIVESVTSGLNKLPPSKREEKAESTSSAPAAMPTGAMNASALATENCDCIGACEDIDGKAKQMQCIKECANSCDGDDDTEQKKDPVKNLLGSLGLREITPGQIEHAERPNPRPMKATEVSAEEAFEECMHNCKTHNYQHSSVGLSVDQCGDTSCEDGCAKYKSAAAFAHEKIVHKTYLRAVDSYPTEPEPKHHTKVEHGKVKESEEFKACMKECKTHNCKHSSVGLSLDQCGDTACADACAGYKHSAAAGFHNAMLPREQLDYPASPKPVAEPDAKSRPPPTHKTSEHKKGGKSHSHPKHKASGHKKGTKAESHGIHKKQVEPVPEIEALPAVPKVTPVPEIAPLPKVERLPEVASVALLPRAEPLPSVPAAPDAVHAPVKPATPAPAGAAGPGSHPPPEIPVAAEKASEDYESCMQQCKTHNCKHTSVGLDTEQCGKTSCEEQCASYHEADAVVVGKHMVHEPGAKVAPYTHAVPVAEGHASAEFEECVKQCKTHNCQKTGVSLDTEQCGDTSCEEECSKGYGEAAFRAHGKA